MARPDVALLARVLDLLDEATGALDAATYAMRDLLDDYEGRPDDADE